MFGMQWNNCNEWHLWLNATKTGEVVWFGLMSSRYCLSDPDKSVVIASNLSKAFVISASISTLNSTLRCKLPRQHKSASSTSSSTGALCCCRHRTGLRERHATSGIWTHVPVGTSIGHQQRNARPTLSAQVQRTCVQHCRSESAEQPFRQSTCHIDTSTFKKKLKTFLFGKFYSILYWTFIVIGLVGHCCTSPTVCHHGLYGSTSCCISHGPCQWERAIFDPPQLRDPCTDFHETWNI